MPSTFYASEAGRPSPPAPSPAAAGEGGRRFSQGRIVDLENGTADGVPAIVLCRRQVAPANFGPIGRRGGKGGKGACEAAIVARSYKQIARMCGQNFRIARVGGGDDRQ